MNILTVLKNTAKHLNIDYLVYACRASYRLIRFKSRTKISSLPSNFGSKNSTLPIDIVVPVIDKDADTLPLVIDSARANIKHPINDIYLVSPKGSSRIEAIAREKNCVVIDEAQLVPLNPKNIEYNYRGKNRAGWIYQQLLKWSGAKFCKSLHYLVIDSDTVFIRPQVFEYNGKMIFDFCDEFHTPYFKAFERLYGINPRSNISFTSHHSLISVKHMTEMMKYLEVRHSKEWFESVISVIDQSEMSCISDYDNYAQYMVEKHSEEISVRYWSNKSVSRNQLPAIEWITKRYSRLYNTVSFHSWNV